MKDIPIRYIDSTTASFNIRRVEDLLAGKDMVQALHRHDFFYILTLKKGAGSHEIDFTSYKVSDHSVFFMRPGQVHQLTLKSGSTGYLMEFKKDFYNPHDKASRHVLRKVSNTNYYPVNVDKFARLFSLLTYVFQEFTDKFEGYQEVIRANLGICFIELVRHPLHHSDRLTSGTYGQDRFEEFLSLLEIHIASRKQSSQYAAMLNLSVYQLNAIIKAAVGKTSSEVINEHIILEAKRYLLATSNQINQIAYQLGYEDPSYFIRFFKKYTGHTPEAFRANFR